MILQINNMLNFNDNYFTSTKTYISSDNYPEQNTNFLNKIVRIRFYDEESGIRMNRLNINKNKFPEFKGYNSYDNWTFRILRFDKEYPNIAILIDKLSRVVVTSTDMISGLYYHEGYELSEDEVQLQTLGWDIFNEHYVNEYIHAYHIQNKQYIGKLVYTEYLYDIKNKPISSNAIIPTDQYKEFSDLKEQLLVGNPNLEVMPDCILKSFPHYYNRHKQDRLDIPRRAINPGIVIRADENGSDPNIVVVEFLPNGTKRYVTDKECFIYYETDTKNSNIGELDLYGSIN